VPALLEVPLRALARALENLVRNAGDASPDGAAIELEASFEGGSARLAVHDRGHGLCALAAQHAGEPFFTTKGPGRGQGLGLFVTRSLAEGLGGSLALLDRPGGGTTAEIRLPQAARESRV
jgi:two-component system sensor histidine kinase RegB